MTRNSYFLYFITVLAENKQYKLGTSITLPT